MPKRKRGPNAGEAAAPNGKVQRLDPTADDDGDINVRLITGSYERILHGINVRIPKHLLKGDAPTPPATFTDSFLFNAHASAVRALALSPPSAPGPTQKRILATGGTDARINLYNLSTHAPRPSLKSLSLAPDLSSSSGSSNKSLGALHAHDASVTALHFPTRGKLVSACAANALAVTSTRTWATLAVLHAPVPRQPNRPAGDTAGRATLPQGVNGLAVHPSRRLMLSVGRAERCLRLWNLTTGRRAGVLEFGKEVLGAVGEGGGRWSGEGRRVAWDAEGTRFVVGWESGAVVYGQDCTPVGCAVPAPKTKIHHLQFVTAGVLAISTEDGRIVFFDADSPASKTDDEPIPAFGVVGQISVDGPPSRIKEFTILPLSDQGEGAPPAMLVAAGSSDGMVRVWLLKESELQSSDDSGTVRKVGTQLGEYATGNRITCLTGFIMAPASIEDVAEERRDDDGSNDDESSAEES